MGKAKLSGSAKLWWKLNCQSWGVDDATQPWQELKATLKERYYPLNYETLKMNEFLSCNQKGRTIELYYEEFIKLSRYAPLITKAQKLSRFILGLGEELSNNEVDALWPTNLADALIRAKAKLKSKTESGTSAVKQPVGNYYGSVNRNIQPHLNGSNQNLGPFNPPIGGQANALLVNQSGRIFQCYKCQEWDHKCYKCPKKIASLTHGRNQQPPQVSQPPRTPQIPWGHGRPQQGGRPNRVNPSSQPPNSNPPRATTISHVTIQEEAEVQAQVYAALDPKGRNQQFLVMEIGGTSQGKTLSFLIDFGSSHSFLSPSTIKRLGLHFQATGRNLRISLANGFRLTTLE